MFGSVGGWFYSALAGINPDPVGAGLPEDPNRAAGGAGSAAGPRLRSRRRGARWLLPGRRDGNTLKLEVTIPVGSEAEIHVPKLGLGTVTILESGKPVWSKDAFQTGVPGVTGAKLADRTVVIQAGSGRYVFEMQ